MIFNETQTNPIQIPNTLIKRNKTQTKNVLGTKYDYDKTSSQGSIEIEPNIAKFQGFELQKLNVIKVKVTNCSSKPQRVHILPPSTAFFSLKFDKKGLLAPGMSEDLLIYFTPNDYKYFYDFIRIHAETEQLMLPIHAYPVINRENLRDVFPKLIDFGVIEQESKIPLNFEFEFSYVKENNDFSIQPIKGIIPGKGKILIEISYTPSTKTTSMCDVELRISQFDFEPLTIKIMGSGKNQNIQSDKILQKNHRNVKLKGLDFNSSTLVKTMTEFDQVNEISENESQLEESTNQYNQDFIKQAHIPKNYNTLDSKDQKPIQKRQRKIIKANSKRAQSAQQQNYQEWDSQINTDTNIMIVLRGDYEEQNKRILLEKSYLNRFLEVTSKDKEKEIKFFRAIGDPYITQEQSNQITDLRITYKDKFYERLYNNSVTRYQSEINKDEPIVGQVVPKYNATWDFYKNDQLKMRKMKLRQLMQQATTIIIRFRVDKRLAKIRQFLKDSKSKDDVKFLVQQDWQKVEYSGLGKKDHVQFKFSLESKTLAKLALPIQYETNNNTLNFKFEVNPRVGFDDLASIEPLNYNDTEVMSYKNWEIPPVLNYPPIEIQRKLRTGAEEEYSMKGPIGNLEKILDDSMLCVPLPKSFQSPPAIELYKIICPHQSLRQRSQFFSVSEVDPEFHLKHKLVQFQDPLDIAIEGNIETLKKEFLYSTPGFDSLRAINYLSIEKTVYFNPKLNLQYDVGFQENIQKYCPEIMIGPDLDDKISQDSDEDYEDIKTKNLNEFLGSLEADDHDLIRLKDKNINGVYDENTDIEYTYKSHLEQLEKEWMSLMPTKSSEYNRFISNAAHKMLVL